MKCIFLLIVALPALPLAAQLPADLYNKTWKVEEVSTVFRSDKIVFYNKDSAANQIDYSAKKLTFYNDGSYKAQNTPSSPLLPGTWSLNNAVDTVTIDGAVFKLIQLNAAQFACRSYSLQLADSVGTIDTAFNYLKLYTASESPLPVALSLFTGTLMEDKVRLYWTTETEISSKQFDIEGSHDGNHFEKIGAVPARGSAPAAYVFDDKVFFKPGKNYYRLKQIDTDNKYVYSGIVSVTAGTKQRSFVRLYPNPAKDRLTIAFDQPAGPPVRMRIKDVSGRLLWSKDLAPANGSVTVALPLLIKGIYTVSVCTLQNELLLTEKLIVQ